MLIPFIKPIEPTFAYISALSGTCVNTFSGDEAYFEGLSNNANGYYGANGNVPAQDSSTSDNKDNENNENNENNKDNKNNENEDKENVIKQNTSKVSPATGNDFDYLYLAICILFVTLIGFVLLKMGVKIINLIRRIYGAKK
jgi:hypothetical protein